MTMVILIGIGLWDLEKKEIPGLLLMILTLAAIFIFWNAAWEEKIFRGIEAILFGTIGSFLMRCGEMGSGDVWVLMCFAMIWPVEVFWDSLSNMVFVLSITASGIWIMDRKKVIQIPMVPFFILGYWMRGM